MAQRDKNHLTMKVVNFFISKLAKNFLLLLVNLNHHYSQKLFFHKFFFIKLVFSNPLKDHFG